MFLNNGFSDWGGYMGAKITKLEEQFEKASSPFRETNLFAGISIFVNGLTNPSADELKRLMMIHGGIYHTYQRSHTTYVIASNLPDVKVRNMNTSKIISPQWVVDCIKEKRILDYTKYLLYTNHKTSQPKINFSKEIKQNIKNASNSTDTKATNHSEVNIAKNLSTLNNRLKTSPNKEEEIFCVDDDDDEEEMPDDDDSEKVERSPRIINLSKPSASTAKSAANASAKTAVDPQFLSEFYNNSRLHHIATLGAGFKQYVSELRENHSGEFRKRNILREKLQKSENFTAAKTTVMHIDMDCFFVSVGLKSYPELRGQPIAVTHSKGSSGTPQQRPGVDRQLERDLYMKRFQQKFHENVACETKADKVRNGFEGRESLSEIASCSYEARKMGIKNGMFVGQALKLCPQLKTIPYDFEGYREVAYTLYDTIAQYTLNIEAVSCDEMFVDLTDLLNDIQVNTMQFVEFVRNEVKDKTGCPCSAGIGGNRLQARMATKKAKPDGQFYLHSENVEEYMKDISISDLPGVGHSTTHSLNRVGCKTCGDLQKLSLSKIQTEIGKKFGETLYQFCRGIDNRPLIYGQVRKSVSAEVNYGIRFTEYTELEKFIQQLCTEVHSRLTKIKRKGKCITLKIMIRSKDAPIETAKFMGHGFCDYLTKSVSLPDFTDNLDVIMKNVLSTMKVLNIPPKELRGIGIQITKLNMPNQEVPTARKENDIKALFTKAMQKQSTASSSKTDKIDASKNTTSDSVNSKVAAIAKSNPPADTTKSPKKSKPGPKIQNKQMKMKQKDKNFNCNIAKMLQNAAPKRPHSLTEEIDGVDPEVLAELPEDIRQEVIRDYAKIRKIENTKKEKLSTIQKESPTKTKIRVDAEFLNILPSQLRKEVEKEICLQDDKVIIMKNETTENNYQTSNDNSSGKDLAKNDSKRNQISGDNIFMRENCEELIKAWVDSSNTPENYDVQILSKHANELIETKNIHDLYDPLVFLKRVINEKIICSWHEAYRTIIKEIQIKMTSTYGGQLLLDDKIDCDKCSLKL